VTIGNRLRTHFTERLLPDAVFQIAPTHLSGIRVGRNDGSVKGGFVQPFRERPVTPSFDRPNVTARAALEEAIDQGKRNLRISSGTAALLIPEPSVRVFVFRVDAFPASGKERDAFIRWRIAKQMPLIPEDARLDYAATPGRGPRKVIAAMARQVVVWEYEALFEKAGLKPVVVGVPSLALLNLVGGDGPKNGLLLNLEDETLTLLALGTPAGPSTARRMSARPPGAPLRSAPTISSGRRRTRSATSKTRRRPGPRGFGSVPPPNPRCRRSRGAWASGSACRSRPSITKRRGRGPRPIRPCSPLSSDRSNDRHAATRPEPGHAAAP
jgi:hypothetical protein